MNNYRNLFSVLLLLFLGFTACTSTKLAYHSDSSKADLKSSIDQLVLCLNERNFDCVADHYATDFYSMNPVVIYDTKAEMIASLKENYTKNNYRLVVEIGEVKAGMHHGHALLRWKMFIPNGEENDLIIDSMNMTIWEKPQDGNWQISRMCFFTPEK